jgi:hypothetical protein
MKSTSIGRNQAPLEYTRKGMALARAPRIANKDKQRAREDLDVEELRSLKNEDEQLRIRQRKTSK